jgi:methylglyoxal synthase
MSVSAGMTRKQIVLIAHDHEKPALVQWVRDHLDILKNHDLMATGTTGLWIERDLKVPVRKLLSGPLGGDQQIGARITENAVDLIIFFWDPLQAQPHDVDVKALLRLAVLYNIPMACNRASADYLVLSPWMARAQKHEPDPRVKAGPVALADLPV